MKNLFITFQQGLDFHPAFDAALCDEEAFCELAHAGIDLDMAFTYCAI